MNALIVQTRRLGDAYYKSATEPRASNIRDATFDPLGYTIERARGSGLEVHAWLNIYRVWGNSPAPTDAKHVVNAHPDWVNRDFDSATNTSEGLFLDPGAPGVREYLVGLIADLASKYDVDGVTLDYVRYPGKRWGYSDGAISAFNKSTGRTGKPSPDDRTWCHWRREQVTETVRAISRELHRLKPRAKLSAATVAWGGCPWDFGRTDAYAHVLQDWRTWMREGLLDANMPMNYKDQSNLKQARQFADWLDGVKRWSYGRHVYCGLMVFNHSVHGATSQVKLVRQRGLEGIVGFAFSQGEAPVRTALAADLKSTVFATPAPIPHMPWRTARREAR